MKTKSMFTAFTFKALIVITCIIVGFVGFPKCDAQSIVGKWNSLAVKQFLGPKGATAYGKQVLETKVETTGSSVNEFKSDHTWVTKSTSINDSKVLTLTGTWSLTGNQLQMKLDPKQEDTRYNPKKDAITPNTTISITGNTMIWNTLYPDSKMVNKIEITFIRM